MKGYSVMWIPGLDHAGIATQVVVEKYLQKEFSVNKLDIGREKFVEKVWEWKEEKGGKILQQLRALGLSLDWTQRTYTMDPVSYHQAIFNSLLTLNSSYRLRQ